MIQHDGLWDAESKSESKMCWEKGISGKTYVLGSGKARPLKEYIEDICDACHESTGKRVTPKYGARPYGKKQVMHLEADISELVKDMGYTPDTDFRQGIKETVRGL